jgi:predicted component of type VI protein secretion system
MRVAKKHAYIKRLGERYVLVNNGAPAGDTLVNETPVADSRELHDGDRIQLGNVILRFQLRAAINRPRPRPRAAPINPQAGSA